MIRVFAKRDLPVMDIIEVQGRVVITPEALAEARAAKELRRAARQQRRQDTQRDAEELHQRNAPGEPATTTAAPVVAAAEAAAGAPPLLSYPSSSSSSDDDESGEDDEGGDASVQLEGERNAARTRSPSEAVVEVPLGHVEQDLLSEKLCTLCIDTLRVNGSRSTYKHPLLVLKACSDARMRQLRPALARRVRKGREEEERRQEATVVSTPATATSATTAPTILFSEWVQQHPDAVALNSLYLDDVESEDTTAGSSTDGTRDGRKRQREEGAEARDGELEANGGHPSPHSRAPVVPPTAEGSTPTYKNYELVGVVRGSVLFNSKPARVFQ